MPALGCGQVTVRDPLPATRQSVATAHSCGSGRTCTTIRKWGHDSAAKPRPPLLTGESRAYPVLPLRDIVVFPHMIVPLFVGREKSIKALEEVMRSDTLILLATQKNASDDDPATDAIYGIGTLASVLQLLKLPDGTVKVLVEGAARAQVQAIHRSRRILRGRSGRASPISPAIRSRPKRWRARSSTSSKAM